MNASMERGFLIDDRGRSWPDNSWELAKRIGYQDPRRDIVGYAIEECGFIHVRLQEGTVHVTLCERRFGLTCFTGAMLMLGRMQPSRIVLSALRADRANAPVSHVFMDLHEFCTHTEPLAAGKPIEIRHALLVEARGLHVLHYPSFAAARQITALWRQTRGEFSPDIDSALAAGGVRDRIIVARQLSRSERLVAERVGAGINFLRGCDIIGRDLDEQPDRSYGAWMAQTYAEVLRSRRVRVESCRAQIRTSTATTLRVAYDRVLIPWRSSGESFAMCISLQRAEPIPVLSTSSRAATSMSRS